MQYGNASWGFRKTPLEEQLRATASMGLRMLELGIANAPADLPLNAGAEQLAQVHRLYDTYGVQLLCAATGNDFTIGSDADVGKVKRVIDICHVLGVRYLRIFAGFSPVDEVTGARWDTMIACLRTVGAYAQNKVTLVVETHGGVKGYDDGVVHFHSVTTRAESLQKLLSELPESIKVLYDPANLWAVGYQNPAEILSVVGNRLAVVHLKDFRALPTGHLQPAACGESKMDWAAQLRALQNFTGPALFEYEITADVADGCKRCLDYLKRMEN